MTEYSFCFGLYRVCFDNVSLHVFRRWPFKTEILIPTDEIAAVSVTQIIPQKVRLTKIFTSGKSAWLPFSPKGLPNDLFDILRRGSNDDWSV